MYIRCGCAKQATAQQMDGFGARPRTTIRRKARIWGCSSARSFQGGYPLQHGRLFNGQLAGQPNLVLLGAAVRHQK
jgi:hypothetical protein